MESHVKIKATWEEMNDLFENDEHILVKYYERIETGLYKCILRHKELDKKLYGTFTIKRIKELLH